VVAGGLPSATARSTVAFAQSNQEYRMTDEEFLALNSIYLRKIASARVVEECTALPMATIETVLSAAQEVGELFDVGDGQCMLSDEGTQAVLREYAARYADQRTDGTVAEWYQRFEVLNGQFLTGISSWQQDGDGDTGRLDRLLRLVERQIKALPSISGHVGRYDIYRGRFERALERVDQGQSDYVVSPNVDSIHNIWFEFHEDILTLLGRPRDVAEAQR
jgi:hypothetical protein